jgi:hypothetical protein
MSNPNDELIEALMQLLKNKAKQFGLDPNAFANDKELIKDMFSDSQEIVASARNLHTSLLDQATHLVRNVTKGEPIGMQEIQQLIICYYRLRDSFLSSLLQIENEFYAYVISQMKKDK